MHPVLLVLQLLTRCEFEYIYKSADFIHFATAACELNFKSENPRQPWTQTLLILYEITTNKHSFIKLARITYEVYIINNLVPRLKLPELQADENEHFHFC